jgi:hypothetical protein
MRVQAGRMQSESARRRRRIGQVLLALSAASVLLPLGMGLLGVDLPRHAAVLLTVGLFGAGLSFLTRGDTFYDRGFTGWPDEDADDPDPDHVDGDEAARRSDG